jgi:hypothetical protein
MYCSLSCSVLRKSKGGTDKEKELMKRMKVGGSDDDYYLAFSWRMGTVRIMAVPIAPRAMERETTGSSRITLVK